MGVAQRKKLAGNTESDPKWKKTKKITNKQLDLMSQVMSRDYMSDLLFDYKDGIKLVGQYEGIGKTKLDSGLTTIEEARKLYEELYHEETHIGCRVELKCWINHSESRNKNNNKPFTYDNYTNHMRFKDYAEQVKLNMIDVSDIGDKEEVIAYLENRSSIFD